MMLNGPVLQLLTSLGRVAMVLAPSTFPPEPRLLRRQLEPRYVCGAKMRGWDIGMSGLAEEEDKWHDLNGLTLMCHL